MSKFTPQHDLTRPRSWIAVFWAQGGKLSLVASAICIAVTLLSISSYRSATAFERDGVVTNAQIIGRRLHDVGDDTTQRFLTYQFEASGLRVERERRVTVSEFAKGHYGEAVTIRYLQARPQVFETSVGKERRNAVALQFVAAIAGLCGLIILWWTGSRTNRAILTRRFGYRTIATVGMAQDKKDKGRYFVWSTSDKISGKSFRHRAREIAHIQLGDRVAVYVRKGFSVWEGDVGPELTPDSVVPKVNR